MSNHQEEVIMEKLRRLPPEKWGEVEDFIDFLNARSEARELKRAATRLSEEAFRKVWDNPDDAEYDKL